MRRQSGDLSHAIPLLLIFLGLMECFVAWSQLFGLIPSGHTYYSCTGTFFNPGPLCGFLSVIIPVALYDVLVKKAGTQYWIAWVYLILSVSLMPTLQGRTGWIAALLGSVIVLSGLGLIRCYNKTMALFCVIISVALSFLLVMLKPESALGRIFIWRNGIAAALSNPFGVGEDAVAGELGSAQESWFTHYPDSIFANVAGSPEYAFNEYMHVAIAYGIPAMVCFCFILFVACRTAYRVKRFDLAGSVVAFAVVCVASYPFCFPEFFVLLGLILSGVVTSCMRLKTIVSVISSSVIMILFTIISVELIERREELEDWKSTKNKYLIPLSDYDIAEINSIGRTLGWSAEFLFDYGKMLRESKRYDISDSILKRGLARSSDPMFLNLLGRNQYDEHNYAKAEAYYLRSINRLPNRLYPYFLLGQLYSDSAVSDTVKFTVTYRNAMNLKPKILSVAIKEMRDSLEVMSYGMGIHE